MEPLVERKLNFDFKISKFNKNIFIGLEQECVDIKSPIDPEVLRARNELDETLEDQIKNILRGISTQCNPTTKLDKTVVHIINLLQIKPVNQAYFINTFSSKAREKKISLMGIKFINTSPDRV